ncbi:unnamed protein product [Adineta steineri]|uniref:Uncharacterized protein n=1 Tax=Adineta steineri TaxID=433720 RepID=A0A819L9V7_9BILA|nr:unnamed protein product [Adineta steineri]CAF3962547.1 unnamed protein product [Adineta steineri]
MATSIEPLTSTATEVFTLPVYDVCAIQQRMEVKETNWISAIITTATDASWFLGPLMNPPDKQRNNLSHVSGCGLTAREVVNRLAAISNEELRKKLGATVLPYIMNKSNEETMKLFDNINFNFNELDDEKGDINVNEQTYQDSSERLKINVYYAKCLLRRVNGKYDINLAYYDYVAEISRYNLRALGRNRAAIDKDLQIAKALAYNKLHYQLQQSWPSQVTLQHKSTLPDTN